MPEKKELKKFLVFDSGPLINFSMNGLLHILENLKKEFNGEFLITKEVKEEIINVPLNIKKFELEALRLQDLFNRRIIKHADITEQEVEELRMIRNNLMETANNMFKSSKKPIHLIDKGEAAAFALSLIMKKKTNQEIPLVIDERTARMICENPENLKKLMEKKLHTPIQADRNSYRKFADFKIIRSVELGYIAYKRGLIEIKDKKILEALVYGLKFKGCSVSEEEIKELIKSG